MSRPGNADREREEREEAGEGPTLIAPTEPAKIRSRGTVSLVPEKHGVDYLIFSRYGGSSRLVGVQRKELSDLVSSVYDGRLGRELNQMKKLAIGVVLIEGRASWTGDGLLMQSSSTWTVAQHLGLIWSIQSRGYWIANAESLDESISWLFLFEKWLSKEKHSSSLDHRPKVKGVWGEASSEEWACHLLQGFEGLGNDKAKAILKHFGGMPIKWVVNADELATVPGIGIKTAERLVKSLNGYR